MSALLHRSLFVLIVLLTLGSGCAGLNREVEGPGLAGPPEGAARVYFALPQGFPSGQAFVVEDTKLLGFLTNDQYFFVDVPAGEHLFMLISEQDEAVRGNFEAGKVYHLKLYITPGFWQTRVYWTPLEATGEDAKTRAEDIADSDRVELNPDKAAKWEAKNAERNHERAQSFLTGEDEAKTIEPKHGL